MIYVSWYNEKKKGMMQWKKDGKEEKELNIHCKPQIIPASKNQEI